MLRKLKKLETYVTLSRSMYFDILNRLGLNHDCDIQTNKTAFTDIVRVRCVLTK